MKSLTKTNGLIELERGSAIFKGGEEGRIYVPKEEMPNPSKEHQYPSTTTVKELLGSIEKDLRIDKWRGQQIDADESLQFYQARGEIAHEYTYKFICDQIDKLDEYEMDLDLPNEKLSNITYTPVFKEHNQIYINGQNVSIDTVEDLIELGLIDTTDVPDELDPETRYGYLSGIIAGYKMGRRIVDDIKEVVYIEQYIVNDEVGYAGQFDLLYVSNNDNLVLTDLKTSSQIHYGYRTQISAYFNGIPRQEIEADVKEKYDIDVNGWFLQIVRHNPEQGVTEIETNKSWSKGPKYHYEQFKKAANEIQTNRLPVEEINF